jgi:hypothetical protein
MDFVTGTGGDLVERSFMTYAGHQMMMGDEIKKD